MGKLYGYYPLYEIKHPEMDNEIEKDMLWFTEERSAYKELDEFKKEYGKNLRRAEVLDIQEVMSLEE